MALRTVHHEEARPPGIDRTTEAARGVAARPAGNGAALATQPRTATYPRHLPISRGWPNVFAQEQIHALATHVLARHAQRGVRTLAITSAFAGEGKTTLTLALGEKLAASGKRIVVLDVDTHRATLSRAVGLLHEAAGVLPGPCPRDEASQDFRTHATDIPGVSIMPVGCSRFGLDRLPVVTPERVGMLLLQALEHHDIALLDCPPLLLVADTLVLREVVDAALMVVRAGSTPRESLDQAIADFGRDKFLGAVLNRVKPHDIPQLRRVHGYYRRSVRGV